MTTFSTPPTRTQPPGFSYPDEPLFAADSEVAQIAYVTRSVGRARRWWTELLVARAERTDRHLARYLLGVQHSLQDSDLRQLQAQALREDPVRFERGAIGAWLSPVVAGLMATAFVASDATFVFNTTRITLDVPESLPFYSLAPANLLALAMAVILTTTCFGAVAVGARTIAYWLDPSGQALHPQTVGPRGQLESYIPRIAYLVISLAVLAGVSVVLHYLAVARFASQAFATDTATANVLTTLITALPSLLLASTVLACNPRFVHVRLLAGHRAKMQRMRRHAVRIEAGLQTEYRQRYHQAYRSLGRLQDLLDTAALRRWPTGLPGSLPGQLSGIPQPLESTPLAGHLPSLVATRFHRLPKPPVTQQLPEVWRQFLDHPLDPQVALTTTIVLREGD